MIKDFSNAVNTAREWFGNGFPLSQLAILTAVLQEDGILTKEIKHSLGMPEGSVSRNVGKLRKRGLVETERVSNGETFPHVAVYATRKARDFWWEAGL